jgi:MFS family permease
VSLNIILLGATGPFLTGLIEVIGRKRMILACTMMPIAGSGLSNFMTAPWQLFLTWGLMVGIGSGVGAMGIATAIANRWFVRRNGLACLMAALLVLRVARTQPGVVAAV